MIHRPPLSRERLEKISPSWSFLLFAVAGRTAPFDLPAAISVMVPPGVNEGNGPFFHFRQQFTLARLDRTENEPEDCR
jgi:hypothetical protein